jgi:hypothetical protein
MWDKVDHQPSPYARRTMQNTHLGQHTVSAGGARYGLQSHYGAHPFVRIRCVQLFHLCGDDTARRAVQVRIHLAQAVAHAQVQHRVALQVAQEQDIVPGERRPVRAGIVRSRFPLRALGD